MERLTLLLTAVAALLLAAAPALAADQPIGTNDHVLISIQGDLALLENERAEVVVVIGGDALIEGVARSVTVIDGSVTLDGATVGTLTIVNGTATLLNGTHVTNDVLELNASTTRLDGVAIDGRIRPLVADLAGLALFLGAAAIVLWIGVGIGTLLAGLALAAFAARQVRTAEAIISREPLKALLAGLLMIIVPPLLVVALALTIFGLPLALSLLFFIWPTLAFVGYLVGAIWLGEWVLRAMGRTAPAERPYLGAVVSLLLAMLLGLVPLVTAIISIFGLGAVTVAGWRTLGGTRQRPQLQPSPVPLPG
ncbi:MAG TPA: hypothetical protein VMP67_01305 [Candidatus Limnocylindria bacterium]|nr:hypothetical protein [Candidatus Limnocylindria bacterium]